MVCGSRRIRINMSKGLIWLCFVAGGLVVADPAAAKVVRCDVCAADVDFRREAELAGAGTHLVYNLHDNVLQQWYVPGVSGVEPPLIVVPVAQLGLNPSVVDKTAYDFVLNYNMPLAGLRVAAPVRRPVN